MQKFFLAACWLITVFGAYALQAQEEVNPPDDKAGAEEVKPAESEAIDGKTAAERGAAFVNKVAREKPAPGSELYPKAAVPWMTFEGRSDEERQASLNAWADRLRAIGGEMPIDVGEY